MNIKKNISGMSDPDGGINIKQEIKEQHEVILNDQLYYLQQLLKEYRELYKKVKGDESENDIMHIHKISLQEVFLDEILTKGVRSYIDKIKSKKKHLIIFKNVKENKQ